MRLLREAGFQPEAVQGPDYSQPFLARKSGAWSPGAAQPDATRLGLECTRLAGRKVVRGPAHDILEERLRSASDPAGRFSAISGSPSCGARVEQRSRFLQIGRIEPFLKQAVDLAQAPESLITGSPLSFQSG